MINLEVRLPDYPGTLIQLIEPVSNNGGNIYSILHYHDKKINNMIPVSITFTLCDDIRDISLKKIQEDLKEKNIPIDKITLGIPTKALVVLLTGHVFDTDVVDTIKRLDAKGVKTSNLQAKFTDLKEVSNVKLKLEIPESMKEKEIIQELNKICEEKGLSLIRG